MNFLKEMEAHVTPSTVRVLIISNQVPSDIMDALEIMDKLLTSVIRYSKFIDVATGKSVDRKILVEIELRQFLIKMLQVVGN